MLKVGVVVRGRSLRCAPVGSALPRPHPPRSMRRPDRPRPGRVPAAIAAPARFGAIRSAPVAPYNIN